MSLDMFDAIFMARRGVLRAQRTPVMRSLHLCCYYRAATDQHRGRAAANNGERVAPAAPSAALSWAHCIPSTTPTINPGSTDAKRATVAERGSATAARSVSPEGLSPLVLAP